MTRRKQAVLVGLQVAFPRARFFHLDRRDLDHIVDVLNQGCSKGHALERWAGHRGLMREQVMAIGDNYNDIEML